MTRSILITGTSSGYGKATAAHFLARDWHVIATMRRPDPGLLGGERAGLRVLPLDVTDPESIAALIESAGPVDVLVNNAGIGMVGAIEATPIDAVRRIFDTNTFGTMAMAQAVIRQMRERRSGTIVNVTSSVTLAPMPLAAAYTASKQAIEGFTGSLAHELAHFGVAVRLVEPGYGPTTGFTANTVVPLDQLLPGEYAEFARPIMKGFASPEVTTRESDVAEAVWNAVHERSNRLRFPAGPDALALAAHC